MRSTVGSLSLIALVVAAAPAFAQQPGEGLSLRPGAEPWPRWQGRLSLSTATPATDAMRAAEPSPLRGVSVMGDYYLTGSLFGDRQAGGLRATSALLIGPRGQTLGAGSLGRPGGAGQGLVVDRRLASDADASSALPYVGIGYTGLSQRGGWGFSADLGVVASAPSQPIRFGRAYTPAPNLDDAVRELRLSPMLQLGVSYSF